MALRSITSFTWFDERKQRQKHDFIFRWPKINKKKKGWTASFKKLLKNLFSTGYDKANVTEVTSTLCTVKLLKVIILFQYKLLLYFNPIREKGSEEKGILLHTVISKAVIEPASALTWHNSYHFSSFHQFGHNCWADSLSNKKFLSSDSLASLVWHSPTMTGAFIVIS